jgi:A/G-specific adenine glycosylase
MSDLAYFREQLILWAMEEHRPLPWKGIKDPYKIWLSEIMLQQTRVEQGMPYYQKFIQRWPEVQDLAGAQDDEVMKMWEGLGYYSRARNMLKAARMVVQDYGGKFPDSRESLQHLPGVGNYTSAAIASFAYGAPVAVVDGNVYRVLSRYMGVAEPIDTEAGKKIFDNLAREALDANQSATYNQAIMDFGALVCKPRQPMCEACPVNQRCQAWQHGQVSLFPVRGKKPARRRRYFEYLVLGDEHRVCIRKRDGKDIWDGLYEFLMIERDDLSGTEAMLMESALWRQAMAGLDIAVSGVSEPFRQVLTHQEIVARFWDIRVISGEICLGQAENMVIERQSLHKFAFPKIITQYLSSNQLSLNLF